MNGLTLLLVNEFMHIRGCVYNSLPVFGEQLLIDFLRQVPQRVSDVLGLATFECGIDNLLCSGPVTLSDELTNSRDRYFWFTDQLIVVYQEAGHVGILQKPARSCCGHLDKHTGGMYLYRLIVLADLVFAGHAASKTFLALGHLSRVAA